MNSSDISMKISHSGACGRGWRLQFVVFTYFYVEFLRISPDPTLCVSYTCCWRSFWALWFLCLHGTFAATRFARGLRIVRTLRAWIHTLPAAVVRTCTATLCVEGPDAGTTDTVAAARFSRGRPEGMRDSAAGRRGGCTRPACRLPAVFRRCRLPPVGRRFALRRYRRPPHSPQGACCADAANFGGGSRPAARAGKKRPAGRMSGCLPPRPTNSRFRCR